MLPALQEQNNLLKRGSVTSYASQSTTESSIASIKPIGEESETRGDIYQTASTNASSARNEVPLLSIYCTSLVRVRFRGHGGVWVSIASTKKMELGNVDGEGREVANCTHNGGGSGQPQICWQWR